MVRNQVPMLTQEQMSMVDGRLDPNQALPNALVPIVEQQGNQTVNIGSPKGSQGGADHLANGED